MHRSANRPVELLLVEDNPADVMLLTTVLKESGAEFKLRVAPDGEDAMRMLLSGGRLPDLMLLDLNLPKMTGHEVLQSMKKNLTLSMIPVVVLSSSQTESDVTTAYRYGASSYLAKPSDIEEAFDLVGAIEKYWFNFALLPSSIAD